MREMLADFSAGKGTEQDLDDLASLGKAIADGALCALGGSAPKPGTHHHPATSATSTWPTSTSNAARPGSARSLSATPSTPKPAPAAGSAPGPVPQSAISGEKKKPHAIDQELCIRCGICLESCKFGAVQVS